MKSHPTRWFGCMRVNAASKKKYAALRRKRRRLRSVGLRPRAMGALRGLAALATPPTEKHPARCLRHSRIKGRLPTRVCLRRVGPASLLPPPASPAPSALPAATSMASARKPPLTLRAGIVHSPGHAVRGAPKLLSEMFAQFLREESWLRFAAQAGRGSAPVPAFALSLRRPPASRPQPACFAPPQYAVPPPCRTQSLRRFFEFFISCCA